MSYKHPGVTDTPRLRRMLNRTYDDPLKSEWCIDLPEGWDMRLTHFSESEGEGADALLFVEITASKRKEDA